ncbi:hypothetical protein E3N88_21280 [Mikania micrantha]|uniref:Uncharacterized protein n=1 Tax=Mikania micrantha TaxID=192012 RepID=A0A5N6NM62_9ASTR|nr:hypothetical protein E3N88_21280 [Mikania micrantha]
MGLVTEERNSKPPEIKKSIIKKVLSHVFPNKSDKKTPLVQKDTRGRPTLKAQKQKEQDVVKDNLASQESIFEPSRHSSFTAVTEKSQKPVFRHNHSTSASKGMPPSESQSQNEFLFPRNMKPGGLNNVYRFSRHILTVFQPYVINIQDVKPHRDQQSVPLVRTMKVNLWQALRDRRSVPSSLDYGKQPMASTERPKQYVLPQPIVLVYKFIAFK